MAGAAGAARLPPGHLPRALGRGRLVAQVLQFAVGGGEGRGVAAGHGGLPPGLDLARRALIGPLVRAPRALRQVGQRLLAVAQLRLHGGIPPVQRAILLLQHRQQRHPPVQEFPRRPPFFRIAAKFPARHPAHPPRLRLGLVARALRGGGRLVPVLPRRLPPRALRMGGAGLRHIPFPHVLVPFHHAPSPFPSAAVPIAAMQRCDISRYSSPSSPFSNWPA
ncbi:hypothetical protein [Gluconacetobacter diazotrophicus]|uniref:hypothetical protein n=1 Tax=Gluconacetobacter diazotrophicus TaxID=33996 RepID=UPI001E3FB8FA|nr:hypothetical protein [Gluconacetobacter diazotrophicus]